MKSRTDAINSHIRVRFARYSFEFRVLYFADTPKVCNFMNISALEHNNAQKWRQVYVPASVKIIEFSAHKVICQNPYGIPTEFDEENEN